jgi:hypothetical protein
VLRFNNAEDVSVAQKGAELGRVARLLPSAFERLDE